MPSVFISYSHDPSDLTHADRVVGLAASLLRDGIKVFFDQKRDVEEEKLLWPIWMEEGQRVSISAPSGKLGTQLPATKRSM
jgi:hypothetical protein